MHLSSGSTFGIPSEERDGFRAALPVLGWNLSLKTEAGISCASVAPHGMDCSRLTGHSFRIDMATAAA